MLVVKRTTSLFNSLCSNVARQVALFLLPVFPYLKLGRFCDIYSTVIVWYSLALHVISDFNFCGPAVLKVVDQKTLVKRRWSYKVRRTVYILTLSEIARHEFTNLWLETFSWTLQGDTLSLSLTGIILDNNLTYDQHIHQLTSSCMTKLCQINRVKNSFDRDTLCTNISALVLSKLFYCSTVWSNTTATNIKKL